MNWSTMERRIQAYILPRWLETWQVQRTRSKLSEKPESPRNEVRRLFIDVSIICMHDAGTGIQRVVREVASLLLKLSPADWTVHAVGATRKQPYRVIKWPSDTATANDDSFSARPGDVFLGLDFALDTIRLHERQLAAFKRQGGHLWFVMYDLLPVQRPDWFSDLNVVRYRKWLRTTAALADGFYCISSAVEAELRVELQRRYRLTKDFQTHVLPMGWNLAARQASAGLPPGFETLLKRITQQPTVLVVGTLEPRKGHADVLAAFNVLWERGCDYNLVLVGRAGWKTEALQNDLRKHSETGKQLFWLDNASDEALTKLYTACHGVIMASHAEGFGLPLVEALGYGKPVLARDLPIFRSHETQGVGYFSADSTPAEFATSITDWISKIKTASKPMPLTVPTWSDTTRSILLSLQEQA